MRKTRVTPDALDRLESPPFLAGQGGADHAPAPGGSSFKTARRRLRPMAYGFVAVLFLVCAGLSAGVQVLRRPRQLQTLYRGSVTAGKTYNAVAVRDEPVQHANTAGQVQFLATEGQSVTAGQVLAHFYKEGWSPEWMQQIYQLQAQILKHQRDARQGPTEVALTEIENRIKARRYSIAEALRDGSLDGVVEAEMLLRDALNQRYEYLSEQFAEDAYVQSRMAEEQELQRRVTDYTQDLEASQDGVVSYLFDGCEELSVQLIKSDDFSADKLRDILRRQDLITSLKAAGNTPIFQVVDPALWTVVITTNTAEDFTLGYTYELAVEGAEELYLLGLCSDIRLSGRQKLYYFDITQPPGALLNQRQLRVRVGGHVTGLVAPRAALRRYNGTLGVWVAEPETGKARFVPVTVTAKGADDCLITAKNPADESILIEGVQVWR